MKHLACMFLLLLSLVTFAMGQVIHADPTDYTSFVPKLMPGDTLLLAPGNYTDRISIQI